MSDRVRFHSIVNIVHQRTQLPYGLVRKVLDAYILFKYRKLSKMVLDLDYHFNVHPDLDKVKVMTDVELKRAIKFLKLKHHKKKAWKHEMKMKWSAYYKERKKRNQEVF